MGDVIKLSDYLPTIAGIARCDECNHSWAAIAPIGVRYLECPHCGWNTATWENDFIPDTYWACHCDNHQYVIGVREDNTTYLMCSKCGDHFNIYIEGFEYGE